MLHHYYVILLCVMYCTVEELMWWTWLPWATLQHQTRDCTVFSFLFYCSQNVPGSKPAKNTPCARVCMCVCVCVYTCMFVLWIPRAAESPCGQVSPPHSGSGWCQEILLVGGLKKMDSTVVLIIKIRNMTVTLMVMVRVSHMSTYTKYKLGSRIPGDTDVSIWRIYSFTYYYYYYLPTFNPEEEWASMRHSGSI